MLIHVNVSVHNLYVDRLLITFNKTMSWLSPVSNTPELNLGFFVAEALSSTEGTTSYKAYKLI